MSLSTQDMLKIMAIFKEHQLHRLQLRSGSQTMELRKDVQPAMQHPAQPARDEIVVRADRLGIFSSSAAEGHGIAAGGEAGTLTVLGTRHPLTAPVGGIVHRILVPQDTIVEYGQPLMVLAAQGTPQ